MRSHPRIRRIAKWTALSLSVLVLVGSILSVGWDFNFVVPSFHLLLDSGWITVMWWPGGPYDAPETFRVARHESFNELRFGWPGYHWSPHMSYGRRIWMPLWLPFVALVITTAVLFLRDRRRHIPGHCRHCGYNLTGNTSGICSECGTKRPAENAPAKSD